MLCKDCFSNYGAGRGNRTLNPKRNTILSRARIPVPPFRQTPYFLRFFEALIVLYFNHEGQQALINYMADNIPPNNQANNNGSSIPKPGDVFQTGNDLAASLIRTKLDTLYKDAPDALEEEAEVSSEKHRSRHQQFMYELMTSGKDLAQIQTEWHNYYQALNDEDKLQVWEEFYSSNRNARKILDAKTANPDAKVESHPDGTIVSKHADDNSTDAQALSDHINKRTPKNFATSKTAASLRQAVRRSAQSTPKLTWKQHLQSALFGLAMGALVIFILLFGFFNEVIIAPFIQPSRNDTATPIILSSSSIAPSTTPEVIIPKINVEIPVDYNINTTSEAVIENDLEQGVIHYPTTTVPGQNGNAAFFGHSSNNILNPGKYKFAFVLLHDLVPGDVFYLTYNDKVYAYKVFSKTIVNPNDVYVLNSVAGHQATATLITCDPPGTSINRLVVVGDQISPNPNTNTAATQPVLASTSNVSQLPGNGPSLWSRYISTLWGKIATTIFGIVVIIYIWFWLRRGLKND